MKDLKPIAVAFAVGVSVPAFAGRDETWSAALQCAYERAGAQGARQPRG